MKKLFALISLIFCCACPAAPSQSNDDAKVIVPSKDEVVQGPVDNKEVIEVKEVVAPVIEEENIEE